MPVLTPFTPALHYLRTALAARIAAARAKQDGERGASVVEWVVITTIVVVVAITVGVVISNLLLAKGKDVETCIGDAGGTGAGDCTGN